MAGNPPRTFDCRVPMPLVVLLVFFLAPAQPVVICFFLFLVSDKYWKEAYAALPVLST